MPRLGWTHKKSVRKGSKVAAGYERVDLVDGEG
jgi:hypothetical protein